MRNSCACMQMPSPLARVHNKGRGTWPAMWPCKTDLWPLVKRARKRQRERERERGRREREMRKRERERETGPERDRREGRIRIFHRHRGRCSKYPRPPLNPRHIPLLWETRTFSRYYGSRLHLGGFTMGSPFICGGYLAWVSWLRYPW